MPIGCHKVAQKRDEAEAVDIAEVMAGFGLDLNEDDIGNVSDAEIVDGPHDEGNNYGESDGSDDSVFRYTKRFVYMTTSPVQWFKWFLKPQRLAVSFGISLILYLLARHYTTIPHWSLQSLLLHTGGIEDYPTENVTSWEKPSTGTGDKHGGSKSRRIHIALISATYYSSPTAPLFYFERWQTLLLALEVYRQQGVSLQVFYVQSILIDILNVLNLYVRREHATVQLWPQLDIPESDLGYNPNNQLVFRNQASAHTDCILQYKMAAEFVIISDIDELLFPTDGFKLPEYFAALLAKAPLSSSFQYRRFNSEFNSSVMISDFSLSALLSSTKITNEEVHAKSVVLPSRVHITGAHFPLPQHILQGYNYTAVPESDNIMVHFRKWNGIDRDSNHSILRGGVLTTEERGPHKTHTIKRFVKQPDSVEAAFRKFVGDADAETILSSLPGKAVYYRAFEKCYDEIWYAAYGFLAIIYFLGPILCDVPPVGGYGCFVSRVRFVRQSIGSDVVLHYSESGAYGIRVNNGCVA
ncbi:Protein F59C6.8 [Aphelenchoides avenae]|nr:Protein F59C6.8 [Aphelenchus avenae]